MVPADASRMLSWVPNGPVQTGFREPPSSSGLGRRPFKAVTRVRTPLGVRKYLFDQHFGAGVVSLTDSSVFGPVAQLVSAPPCHGGGRRFEPGRGRLVRRDPDLLAR